MNSFFSCFSCGDKADVTTPESVPLIKPRQIFQSRVSYAASTLNLSSIRYQDFADTKSRSNTTVTLHTADTTLSSNEDDDTMIQRKIEQLRTKSLAYRKAIESYFIKQNLTRGRVVYLIEKEWSEEYSYFLRTIEHKYMRTINNYKLLDSYGYLRQDVKEKSHFFIINYRIWKLLQLNYKGGPVIVRDMYFPVYLLLIKPHEVPCIGLINPLNLCFMISTLQCLLSVAKINLYFYRKSFALGDKDFKKKPLHLLMHRLIKQLTDTDQSKIDIKYFAAFFYNKLNPYEQHDAHEFLLYLIYTLQEYAKQDQPKRDLRLCKDPEYAYTQYHDNNRSIVDRAFMGQIETSVICRNCDSTSTSYVPFFDIALEIVEDSLYGCLTNHFSCYKLDDLYECERCHKRTKASKKYTITKTPNILIVSLKKFARNSRKIEDRIKYSLQLDLEKYSKGHCGETKYSLQSVQVHKGVRSTKGHYYAYTNRNKTWYYANDEVTKKLFVDDVLGKDAYILYYYRCR